MPGYIYIVDARESSMAGNKKKVSRKARRKRKIAVIAAEVLVLFVLLAVCFVWQKVNKIQFDPSMSDSEAGINSDLGEETLLTLGGFTNIALFGLDNRGSNDYASGNSDTIMIASINNETHEVKLVSVYRDTYLNISKDKYKKANSAYSNGGAVQAVQMLNTNLDLNITEYVCVDWNALVETIDALGGIDIQITEQEVKYINFYLWEIDEMTGLTTPEVEEAGLVHLDGTQATAYARIRYTGGDDFKRASRQRIVLQAMVDKAKKADLKTLNKICDAVFDDIATTLSLKEILSLLKALPDYEISSTTGFPFELTTKKISGGDTVIPAELDNNVVELHKYLFDETDYTPTSTVQKISDYIVNQTGITEDSKIINTDAYNETVGVDGTGDLK